MAAEAISESMHCPIVEEGSFKNLTERALFTKDGQVARTT